MILGPPIMLRVFAEAYHAAALSGWPMVEMTGSLEAMREKLLRAPTWFEAWQALDDNIGAAHGRHEQPALLVLRTGFVREVVACATGRVVEAGAGGPEHGWQELAEVLGEAVAHERFEIIDALASNWTNPGPYERQRALMTHTGRMLVRDRWIEAREGVQALADAGFRPAPVRARLWRLLGQIDLYHIRNSNRARECFERAMSICETEPVSLVGMGEVVLRQGRTGEAREWGERALRANADSPDACSLMAECASTEGDFDGAERWYLEAVRRAPGAQTGYLGLCDQPGSRAKQDDEEGSLADLSQRASVVKPSGRVGVLLACGRSCEQAREYVRAREWYTKATAEAPDRIDAHAALGYLALSEGNFGEARRPDLRLK